MSRIVITERTGNVLHDGQVGDVRHECRAGHITAYVSVVVEGAEETFYRITDDGSTRSTDTGDIRIYN